jgi:uncharacterized protein (TIRG00374 family)
VDESGQHGSRGAHPPARHGSWRLYLKPAVSLLIAGVCIYILLPKLLSVFASWHSLEHLEWPFAILVVVAESASYVCLWELDRIALATRGWFAIACAQLSGNALGRIVPGSATPFTVAMLHSAGVDTGEAAASFTASTLLQIATALALPIVALPAILGGAPVNHSLLAAAYLGLGALVLLLAVGAVLFSTDKPLILIGKAIQWVLNATVRRRRPVTGLSQELLSDRNFIRHTLSGRWKAALAAAVANSGFDFLALLFAIRAVGASPRPSLVVLAYAAAEVLANVPFTPGGLGFVEAGLVGMLSLAGVTGAQALAATLLYRLVSYWIPIPAGGVTYILFRRRYPHLGLA